jgi:hypothetical protein
MICPAPVGARAWAMVTSGELSLVAPAQGGHFAIHSGQDACRGGGGGTVSIGYTAPFSHEYFVCVHNATGQLRLLQEDDVGYDGSSCTWAVRPGMDAGRPATSGLTIGHFSLLSALRPDSFVGVAEDGHTLALLPVQNSTSFQRAVTMSAGSTHQQQHDDQHPRCGGGAVVVSGRNYLATTTDLQRVAAASLTACCGVSTADPAARMFVYTPGILPASCGTLPPGSTGGCCHVKGGFLRSNLSAPGYFSGVLPNRGPPAPPPPPAPPAQPPAPPAPPGAKNVLILLADDWRSNLGAALNQSFVITPAMDKFAASALTFTRAYVQQTVCSPSRNSCEFSQLPSSSCFSHAGLTNARERLMRAVMTGRRPEQTKVFNFIDDFRSGVSTGRRGAATEHPVGANWTTMPGYFLQHGYRVYGAGKVSVARLCMQASHESTARPDQYAVVS